MVTMDAWLSKVDEIAAEGPSYQLGHDGAAGKCDCIGLVIGAIRRAGGKWTGTHGSNWAARNAMDTLLPVTDAGDLQAGQVVYKAAMPGQSGYNLPGRYKDDVDKRDYYHVGVVRSVDPLDIVHCTGPGIVHDKKLGKWNYAGWIAMVSRESEKEDARMQTAIVTAESGSTVNLRKTPEGALLDRVPVGSEAHVLDTMDGWARVTVAGKTGWMDKRYLQMQESGAVDASGNAEDSSEVDTVTIVLPRSAAEKLLAALGGVLGWG